MSMECVNEFNDGLRWRRISNLPTKGRQFTFTAIFLVYQKKSFFNEKRILFFLMMFLEISHFKPNRCFFVVFFSKLFFYTVKMGEESKGSFTRPGITWRTFSWEVSWIGTFQHLCQFLFSKRSFFCKKKSFLFFSSCALGEQVKDQGNNSSLICFFA